MSSFDVLSSIAWGLTTLPINRYDQYGYPTGIYAAWGNTGTCKAQGFLLQLGFTGALYNLTLSLYYTLVIGYGWPETKLRKVRIWFHTPVLIGVSLACAAIPFYRYNIGGCYLPPPPLSSSYRDITIFFFIPVSIVVVVATVNMAIVVWTVRKNTRKVQKWRKGSNKGSELERQVMLQAIFYLGGFYLAYPIMIGANVDEAARAEQYWLFLACTTLVPLQGFMNFSVYIRPRVMRHLRRKQKERRDRRENRRKRKATNSTAEQQQQQDS